MGRPDRTPASGILGITESKGKRCFVRTKSLRVEEAYCRNWIVKRIITRFLILNFVTAVATESTFCFVRVADLNRIRLISEEFGCQSIKPDTGSTAETPGCSGPSAAGIAKRQEPGVLGSA
jgi:hypothetical protein